MVTGLLVTAGFLPDLIPKQSQLQQVLKHGELRIATRISPLSYQPMSQGISGLDYDLAVRFATYLGVKPSFHPVHRENVFSLLELGKVDIAAANLAISEKRMEQFLFGPTYLSKSGVLVGNRERNLPAALDQLSGFKVLLNEGSHFIDVLDDLGHDFSSLDFDVLGRSRIEDLLNRVTADRSVLALVDSTDFERLRFLYPEVEVAFEMIQPQPVAWAFRKDGDLSLYLKAVEFFQRMTLSGELNRLESQYAGNGDAPDYIESIRFLERLGDRLPDYRQMFMDAAEKTGLDWRLLAAVSYQESHWNPDARSFTGVRGLMMLTHQTARQFDIEDRTDPQQSILGGALYLRSLLENQPLSIRDEDRLWFALAAYNVGPGHLEDARVITQKLGGDPNQWLDVEPRLNLLADENWYTQTRYGKARGHEPVHFVRNVRLYYDVMKSLDRLDIEIDRVRQLLARDIVSSPVL